MVLPRNIELDARTVEAMVRLHCEGAHHSAPGSLCTDCSRLLSYAEVRLSKCPFGPDKTTCRECSIHCYRPIERAAMKIVMREAGPRMLWRHPLLAIRHLWLDRKGAPPWPPRGKRQTPAGQGL